MPMTSAIDRARLRAALAVAAPVFAILAFSLAPAALAQDSTAPANGLPGDALDAYSTAQQSLNYIVDLGTKTSSWNRAYAVAPIVKASRSNISGYFDLLVASQALSNRFSASRPMFSSGNYSLWSSPGQGINSNVNTISSFLSPTGKFGQQFALSHLEFGPGPDGAFGSGDDENNVVGSALNFQFRNPNRLWVSRVYAMQNKTDAAALGTASFGVGAVDELGTVHLYADSYGMTSTNRLSQRELERVRLPNRTPTALNTISQLGGASDFTSTNRVRITSTSMTVPAIIPQSLATRPVMLATDFSSNLIAETTNLNTTVVPVPGGSPRGSLAFIPTVFTPTGGVGTAATLVRTDANTKTRGVEVFGLSASGAVATPIQLVLPTSNAQLVDPIDAFSPGAAFAPLSNHEFTNYASQASFRGGSSQVALTVLSNGDLLTAALVASTGGGSAVPQSQDNYIAVARVPAAGGAATWTVAAHTGSATINTGKAILGIVGSSLAPIGRLVKFNEVYGSATTGPSLSSPAMDRAGNLYFMATISLDGVAAPTLTTGLLRANRNPATNGYELELLARLNDIQLGQNSGRNYQIQFMGIADADSISSGSIFSSNIVQDVHQGVNLSALPYASPFSLGLLAFHAKIVYDTNNDGLYVDPSGPGASGGNDQAYNVVLALMPKIAVGDFNRDGGKTVQDIFDFLAAWFANSIDYNGDGAITVQDIFDFLGDWFAP